MLFAALVVALMPAADDVGQCQYDRSSLLALDLRAFDQDMNGGWRILETKGCTVEAADSIREWRKAHGSVGAADTLLSWHEGQLRADVGQYADAIRLFEAGRHPATEDAKWGWNLYVDGTVAFLRGNRRNLKAARAKLAALPRPPELKEMIGPDGKPKAVRWPMNIRVLDSFLRCWGQSYNAAYRCPSSGS